MSEKVNPYDDGQMLEWGTGEDALRKQELKAVESQGDLERVQKAASRRRRSAGLSSGQAATAIRMAQLKAKGYSPSLARRRR